MILKKLLSCFICVLLLVAIGLTVVVKASAQDLSISCDGSGTCTPATSGPLFSSSEIWEPGKIVERTVRLTNSSGVDQIFGTQAQNTLATGNMDTVLNLSITRMSTSTLIWTGTLNDFYNAGEIQLGTFGAGAFEDFNCTVSMNQTAGNEYQGKSTAFDLVVGFIGTTTTTTTGGGGTVAGAGVSAPTCSDTPPGSAPTLLSAVAGLNTISLFWSEATDPVTYYLIAFGTTPSADQYGSPNVGGKGTTSYVISGVSGGTTYYVKVRAGNGCAPGAFSNIVAVTPTGGFIAGVPPGFVPGVLGEATEAAKLRKPGEEAGGEEKIIKGEATTRACRDCAGAIPLLLLQLVVGGGYALTFGKSLARKYRFLLNLILSLGFSAIFLSLNKNCSLNMIFANSAFWLCRFYLYLNLLILLALSFLDENKAKE